MRATSTILLLLSTIGLSQSVEDGAFMSAMKNLIWGAENQTQSDSRQFHQYQTAARSSLSTGTSCTLPQQIGTGPYRIPRWYYNPARQRCELFYWSGCCGNGNNFQTFQSCQTVCEESPNPCAVQTAGPLVQCAAGSSSCGQGFSCHVGADSQSTVCCPKPSPLDRCQQPLNIGIGNANMQRWYFNPLTQQCQACVYKGLQGNENNFLSRNECENSCLINPCRIGSPFRSQGVTVQCSAMNPNVCPAGHYCHIGADQSTSVCCQALGGDPCGQPMDRGVGSSQLQRWYWNVNSQCCLPFNYCGTKGTQNNFLSRTDCERTCYELDNPCAGGNPLMGSDNRPLQCSAQTIASCGNAHWCHFGASQSTTVCCPQRVDGDAICALPLVEGSGEDSLDRWHYDSDTRQCVEFVYKGRMGNQNNFLTREACESQCPVFVNVCPAGSPLLDSTSRPIPCTFGSDSCGDSHWCHLGLVPDEYQCCPGTPTNPGACRGGPSVEGTPSDRASPSSRWYFDKTELQCKTFIFNGRKGSQNNFLTKEDCEATCDVFENPCNQPIQLPATMCSADSNSCGPSMWCHIGISQETTVCCPSEGDPCQLPLNRGQGSQFVDRWFYNQQTSTCQSFTYAGMKGNQNNFQSRESCEERCGPNPCFEGRPFQGVDGRPQTCTAIQSINTCPANHWCHVGADMSLTVCCPGASTNVCNLPMSTGEGNYNLDRYYFDSNARTCRPFKYNGLKGNQNNFLTLRACQLACQPLDNPCIGQPATTAAGQVIFCSATNKDACPVNFWCHLGATPETTVCCPGATNPCSVPLAPGTGIAGLNRYYYNPDDRVCTPFTYNGKRGNQNNFETQAECDRTCPEELCLLSIDRGACAGRVTRYAFDRQTNQCIAFEYTGCGGNLNNFVSSSDCEETCAKIRFRR